MALGTTQPLTQMSTRCISWGKGGRCVRLTTLPPSCAVVMKSGNLNFLEPSVTRQACNGTAFTFLHNFKLYTLTFRKSVNVVCFLLGNYPGVRVIDNQFRIKVWLAPNLFPV
jgi:hypothetical protein